ncbi:MAG: diguanylate cyclase (GGDEF)-like protein/PAS domain S-box-containing protein [Cognaticolwellia sp.]|jgi:diguanylate cyclase (GGDEF)-like protein/PAS domain S-box-containing protein
MKIATPNTNSRLKKSSYIKIKNIGYYASLFIFPTLMVIIGINLWLNNKSEEAREWVDQSEKVKASLYQVLLSLKAAETGQRGYLLTEDKSYLEPYTHSIARLDKIVTSLQVLTLKNLKQQNSLKKIKPLIDEKLSELKKTIFLITTQDREAGLGIVMSGKGQRLMEQLNQIIEAMLNEESLLLIDRNHALNSNQKFVIWTQLIGSILLILIWALTLFHVRKLLFQQAKSDEILVLLNEELAFQNQEKDKRTAQLTLAASVFTHAVEAIVITDAENIVIDVNSTFVDVTGYSYQEVVGQASYFFQTDRHPPEFYSTMWQVINTTGQWAGEILSRRQNGEKYIAGINISAVKDAVGKVSHYVGLFSDITLQRDYQYQLEQMAHFDALTKLPNRTLLADRLNQAMLQCQRHYNSLAVIFMDLDGFKEVNDSYGHAVGDELLIIVSGRMSDALREVDTLARFGGDEFVAILSDLVNAEDYKMVLARLLRAASEPITVGDLVLKLSVSIGVTLYPQNDADADILIRHADQAMYMAKKAGKNCYHLFDSALDDAVNLKLENISYIRTALNKHEFVLYYQPKVNMSTGEVVGVEALIRWQHPVRGLVPPLDFLPLIEKHAISLEIGEWVIDTALSQISQWQSIGITLPISVNISAYQLQQTDFVERLATLLAAYPEVSPHLLELEILETSAFSDINYVIATMKACLELGVEFALDDFGTGYSSLTYLKRLPASVIKIDQSFVRDMLTDSDDLAIVMGVVSLAKAFELEVIAEGVETLEHGTELLQLGCKLAQGYGISRPMPLIDIPTWLDSWQQDSAWLA